MYAAVVASLSSFTSNHAQGAGGALYVSGSAKLNLTRSLLAGNMAQIHGAGVAVWHEAAAYLDTIIVKDNIVHSNGGSLSVGGTAKVVVLNVTFRNNTSHGCCGAVYGYENSTTKIMHTLVAMNSALGSSGGGGIGVWENATMVIVDANLTNNTAEIAGGAVYSCNNTKVAVVDSILMSNQARNGGAIYVSNNSVQVIGCRMSENIASSSGGAVAVDADSTCVIDACTMHANHAASGGAVFLVRAKHALLRNCVFRSNVATDYGGGVHVGGDTKNLTVSACQFLNNSARQEAGALSLSGSSKVYMVGKTVGAGNNALNGGFATVDENAHLEVTGGVFERNYASANGRAGFMYVTKGASVVLRACDIQGKVYQPDVYGGAFNLEEKATLELLSCTMSGMHAFRGGAIAAFTNSSFHARNSSIINCTASSDGGGVFTSSYSHQSWLGGSFRLVYAKEGAAMYIFRGTVDISDTTFVNGTAPDGGGALHVANTARVALDRCNIQGCVSGNSGGGGLLVKGDAQVAMLHTNISYCHTERGGGAIAGHGNATLLLESCVLQRNTGIVCGGGVHVEGTARMVASNCGLLENTCDDGGGGMCALENSSFIFRDCVVSRNAADRGGGIWLEGQAAMGLQHTRVNNNTALSLGGGVMLYSSRFSLAELQAAVMNNKAPISGKDVTVIPTTITNTNKSTVEGFVSRLGTDAGLLNVTLRVTGVRGLAAESTTVHALVDGLVVDKKKSGANGIINMLVKLRKPPGMWTSCTATGCLLARLQ
jgi:hypothetical protein